MISGWEGSPDLETTKNRSLIGMLTDFSYLLDHHADPDGEVDLLALGVDDTTVCGSATFEHRLVITLDEASVTFARTARRARGHPAAL